MKKEVMKPPEMVLYTPKKIGLIICKNFHKGRTIHVSYIIGYDGKIWDDPKMSFVIKYINEHGVEHPREIVDWLPCLACKQKKLLPRPQ